MASRHPGRRGPKAGLLVVWALGVLQLGCPDRQPISFDVDARLLDANSVPFVPHSGEGPFDNYLAVNLPFAPAQALLADVEAFFGQELVSRGEAHITVITPVEYQRIADHLDIAAIDALAGASVQSTSFDVVCLGRATADLGSGTESTFFLVVDAPALVGLRRAVQEALVAAGGSRELFDPMSYAPHITLGFTLRDLHERDGAVKDPRACIAGVRLKGGQAR